MLRKLREKNKRLEGELRELRKAQAEPVAIVGLSCRFPANAVDPSGYWAMLRAGRDAVAPPPAHREPLLQSGGSDGPADPAILRAAYVTDAPLQDFDPAYFGLSEIEAATIDPQHRLLLEGCWTALESGGYRPDQLDGSRTGIFIGMLESDFQLYVERNRDRIVDGVPARSFQQAYVAGRISYLLGARGPSFVVNTLCSSSLVAAHLACQSVRQGECDLALAGGVKAILQADLASGAEELGVLSRSGRCLTFDARANGAGGGEGCGVVLLKRLSHAVRDGDEIFAVIAGTAVNQDGRSSALTAPSGVAQEELLVDATKQAFVDPLTIQYVEAHGTGTELGDPIEIDAIADIYGAGRQPSARLAIGSAKTNLAHTECAAGVAGVLKAVLSLRNEELVPHLHLRQLSPHIQLERFEGAAPGTTIPWPRSAALRLAAVSSFGMSGTNAHVVLREPPLPVPRGAEERSEPTHHLLCLSAPSAKGLEALADLHARHLRANPGAPLTDLCYTAVVGRGRYPHRAAVVAPSAEQLVQQLQQLGKGSPAAAGTSLGEVKRRGPTEVAFLFTGQGAQYPRMGQRLYRSAPRFRRTVDRCAQLLEPHLDRPLLGVMFSEDAELLARTRYTQPALFVIGYALADLWSFWGVQPRFVIGHSVGELAAACFAGVFSLEDGLRLVANRGRLMDEVTAEGSMLTLFCGEEAAQPLLEGFDRLSLAARNAPGQVVISGAASQIEQLATRCKQANVKSRRLRVSHAFHSPLMEPILEAFGEVAASVKYQTPELQMVSNLDGRLVREEVCSAAYWVRHLREAVRFEEGIQSLHRAGATTFIEVGPAPILVGLGKRSLDDDALRWLPSLRKDRDDWQQLLGSAGELHCVGAELDWRRLFDGARKLQQRGYPFQRRRLWPEMRERRSVRAESGAGELGSPILHRRLALPLQRICFESILVRSQPWLKGFVYRPQPDNPKEDFQIIVGPMYLAMVHEAVRLIYDPARPAVLEDIAFHEAAFLPTKEVDICRVQLHLTPEASRSGARTASFEIYSRVESADNPDPPWRLNSSGTVALDREDPPSRGPAPAEIERLRASCSEHYDGAATAGQLLGPSMRGYWLIDQLWRSDGLSVARLRPNAVDRRHVLDPSLGETCLMVAALAGGTPEEIYGDYTSLAFIVHLREFIYRGVDECEELWCVARVTGEAVDASGGARGGSTDIHLVDGGGRRVIDMYGVSGRRLDFSIAEQRRRSNWLHEVRWREKEPSRASEPARGASWLLCSHGASPLADALTSQLARHGLRARTVQSPEALAGALAAASKEGGCAGVVQVGVGPSSTETEPVASADGLTAQLRSTTELLELFRAIHSSESAPLWIVTSGAQRTNDAQALVSPAQSVAWGFGRVFPLERPDLSVGLIDVDPQDDAVNNAEAIVTHLIAQDGEEQIAVRGGRRYVPRLMRSARLTLGHKREQSIRADASYLLTGGLGGLGLATAEWLVNAGARHLVLVDRRDAGPGDQEILGRLRGAGVEVVTKRCDIADQAAVEQLFAALEASLPPLAGLMHLAGVVDTAQLLEHDWKSLLEVVGGKTIGAWNLHRATVGRQLDFFVLFSSVIGLLPVPGGGAYAGANLFLDSLAQLRAAQGQPAVSIQWCPWGQVGMATKAAARTVSKTSIGGVASSTSISVSDGTQMLGELLSVDAPNVAVLPLNWSAVAEGMQGADVPSLLADILPLDSQAAEMELAGLSKVELLRRAWCRVTGQETASESDSFFDVGGDSLGVLELVKLARRYGLELKPEVVFSSPTFSELAASLEPS